MSDGAILFLAVSWAAVLCLVAWSYWRMLTSGRRDDR